MSSIRNNSAAHRYELREGEQLIGELAYRSNGGGVIELYHTAVDAAHEGQGLGGELVRHALEQLREAGERVNPTCPFVAAYIERHPEFEALVAS